MASKNDKLPGHKWFVKSQHEGYFWYECKVCKTGTRNGVALIPPFNKECNR